MRLAFGVEYDGTDFCGWQRQQSGRTVQACLEEALSRVADHEVSVICAGRTDTGVHATGQVVHISTDSERSSKGWVMGVNANLPADIRVQWVTAVDDSFHARFSARRRHYRYVILNRRVRSALLRHRTCWEYRPLDEQRMTGAAEYLVGEHDFTSFRAVACQAPHPVRTIYTLAVSRQDELVYIDVIANAFLHHMVRSLAGSLMSVGCGDRPVEWVGEILAAKDRAAGAVTAPAAGLYLVAVSYPEQYALPLQERLPVFGN